MEECLVKGTTLPEAYHNALVELYKVGDKTKCGDWNCEQIECSMTMIVEKPLQEPMISKLCIAYPESLEQYKEEILDGILDFNIGICWQYTYHNRMVSWNGRDQIQFVIDELKRNPESRRAVIDVRDNEVDMYSNDPACLQNIQYFIRDNKLHCKVLFRSNDATRATFMNAFAFILLQKKIADELGIEVGTYTHRANSFHCYESEFEKLYSYNKTISEKPVDNLTYYYVGDWKDQMEECKEDIAGKVYRLRTK